MRMPVLLAMPLLACRLRALRVVHVLEGECEPVQGIDRTRPPRIGGCGSLRFVLALLADVLFRMQQRRDDETEDRYRGQQERSV